MQDEQPQPPLGAPLYSSNDNDTLHHIVRRFYTEPAVVAKVESKLVAFQTFGPLATRERKAAAATPPAGHVAR